MLLPLLGPRGETYSLGEDEEGVQIPTKGQTLWYSMYTIMPLRSASTELAQQFAYKECSCRRMGAVIYMNDMVWLYRSPIQGEVRGVCSLFILFLTAFAAPTGRGWGGGGSAPSGNVGKTNS